MLEELNRSRSSVSAVEPSENTETAAVNETEITQILKIK